MDSLYDLSQVEKLIHEKQSSAIVIIDTNVFIEANTQNFKSWKTKIPNAIFIISDIIPAEITHCHNKNKEEEKFRIARDLLIDLNNMGKIQEGIFVPEVGWFIGVRSPPTSRQQNAFDQVPVILQALKQNDTLLLLLTNDCCNNFDIPTTFLTRDAYQYACGKHHVEAMTLCGDDVPSTLENWFKRKKLEVNWDGLLTTLQSEIECTTYKVEFTLKSKKFVQDWQFRYVYLTDEQMDENSGELEIKTEEDSVHADAIVLEGDGRIFLEDGQEINFSWRVPLKPEGLVLPDKIQGDFILIDEKDIDYFGKDDKLSFNFKQALITKLRYIVETDSEGISVREPLEIANKFVRRYSKPINFLKALGFEESDFTPIKELEHIPDGYDELRKYISIMITKYHAEVLHVDTVEDGIGCLLDVFVKTWGIGQTIVLRVKASETW